MSNDLRADLRRLRESAHLSQNALSKRLGMTSGAVSRIESGERGLLLDTLRAWAEACGYVLSLDFVSPTTSQEPGRPILPLLLEDETALVVRFAQALPSLSPSERAAWEDRVSRANYFATRANEYPESERRASDIRHLERSIASTTREAAALREAANLIPVDTATGAGLSAWQAVCDAEAAALLRLDELNRRLTQLQRHQKTDH